MEIDRRAFAAALIAAAAFPRLASAMGPRSAAALIAAARRQVGVTRAYDPGYTPLAFPGGDVPRERGVCTDVVVRAYRDAFSLDLQALVHADMAHAFAAYPHGWGLRGPDANIDHRRVPNLRAFFARAGASLPIPDRREDWVPGDLFTSLIGGRLPHTGIVIDGAAGRVIHNIGRGAREEAALFDHPLTARYRWRLDA